MYWVWQGGSNWRRWYSVYNLKSNLWVKCRSGSNTKTILRGSMSYHHRLKKTDSGKKLPLEIYTSAVEALYADQKVILFSAASVMYAASIIFYRTDDFTHLFFSLLIWLVGIKRSWDARIFTGDWYDIKNNRSKLKIWERHYLMWGSFNFFLLGFWCFYVLVFSSDDFAVLMTISLVLANLIGILGRNFASERVVNSQLFCIVVPFVAGLFLAGDFYKALFCALLVPFFYSIKTMSDKLRGILTNSTVSAYENEVIAGRFDAALNNISHGIAMINDSQQFVVVNDKFADLVGVGDQNLIEQKIENISGGEISQYGVASAGKNIFVEIEKCLQDGQTRRYSYILKDKRIIEYNYYPMKEGGVILLEDISLRVASEVEISILAKYDPLTHLPNRRFFMEEVHRLFVCNGNLEPCSLYFVDLDKFKIINDSLGHTTGDKLLNTISIRLKSLLNPESQICRFGGDEFVILVPKLIDREKCGKFAERLITEISKPLLLDGHQIIVGATVGISLSPDDANDPNHLLKYSDASLYQAKTVGRGTYAFYSEELGQSIRNKRQIELDLRNAIDRGQFQINYQPLVNLAENKIYTCEALLRWNHPERGWVSPGKFIPIAEEIGFITNLGEYVLENAALQCLKWPSHIRVAVNVSSIQFRQSDVTEVVSRILKKTGLEPNRLEVEVTESCMLEDVDSTNEMLTKLSRLGVRISLDDFGTGFSSLSYLHTLPLDKVKIDRSFIENIHSDDKSLVLLEGISNLSHSLGLKVVVEGIETADQLSLLQERIHVDEVQGFLFGKALPAASLTNLLNGKDSLYAAERSENEKIAKKAVNA